MLDCLEGDEVFGACCIHQQGLCATNQPLETVLSQGNGTVNEHHVTKVFTKSGGCENGIVRRHLNAKISEYIMK